MKPLTATMFLTSFILFWNVENFFEKKHSTDKCNAICKLICKSADIYGTPPAAIGLCEVENSTVLRRLTNLPAMRKMGYSFIHFDSSDKRGIDCALLYRRQVLGTPSPGIIPFKGTRDILYARFDSLSIIVLHLPSRIGRSRDSLRRAILLSASTLADSLGTYGPVLCGGDFNQERSALSDSLLLPMREISATGAEGTIKFQGKWETIDRCAALGLDSLRVDILWDEFLLEEDKKFGGVKPRRTYIGPSYNAGVSDHLPIAVVIY